MGRQKQDAKIFILPHTKAKLDLYEIYLGRYLAILGVVDQINKINIFDVFCGTGIYKNGKAGSPILAFESIERNRKTCKEKGRKIKPILLSVNDGNPQYVEKVKTLLTNRNDNICELEFNSLAAKEMLEQLKTKIGKQRSGERNLIFIDPYGYQDIHKEDLIDLLKTNKTEIILFLPIAHMYRFKKAAVKDYYNPAYEKLRKFIYEFFPPEHPISQGHKIDVFQFIKYLKQAFSFMRFFYSASFYIQRDPANYYALFFISPSLLGCEKILEVIWELDPETGRGFDYNKGSQANQIELFDEYALKNVKKIKRMKELEGIIVDFLSKPPQKNNHDLYKHILENDFLPKHANQILEKLQDAQKLEVWDAEKDKPARKRSFYLAHKHINSNIKAKFKLLE